MKQNQLEIALEPWSNEQQTIKFMETDMNNKNTSPEKNSMGKQSPRIKQYSQKRQMNVIKKAIDRNYQVINNNTIKFFQRDSRMSKLIADTSPDGKYQSVWESKTPKTPVRGQNLQKNFKKVPVYPTFIGYVDVAFNVPNRNDKIKSSNKYTRSKSNTLQVVRPVTSANFYPHNRSYMLHNAVEHLRPKQTLDEENQNILLFNPNSKAKENPLANYTIQYQKMLKLKDNLRQRKKYYSNRRQQQRQSTLNGTMLGKIQFRNEKNYNIDLKTIRSDYPLKDEQVEDSKIQAESICHERTLRQQPNRQGKNTKSYQSRFTQNRPISVTNFSY